MAKINILFEKNNQLNKSKLMGCSCQKSQNSSEDIARISYQSTQTFVKLPICYACHRVIKNNIKNHFCHKTPQLKAIDCSTLLLRRSQHNKSSSFS